MQMNNLLKAFLVIVVFNSCNDAEKTVSNDETIKQLTSPVDSVSAEPYLFTDPRTTYTQACVCALPYNRIR